MDAQSYVLEIHRHVHEFFEGHDQQRVAFDRGAITDLLPGFHAIEVAPGRRTELWTYVSVGVALVNAPHVEFVLTTRAQSERQVELLAMCAYYHHTEGLGLGHTFPIGQPWLPRSTLDNFLVSLPYPFGPDLEDLSLNEGDVQVLWLLPITRRERDFATSNGVEAIEQRFDEVALEYWNPQRNSVV